MSIYKTYILLTDDFIFARGLELEIKSRYKDARVISGCGEKYSELIDLLNKDANFPMHAIALCDIDALSTKMDEVAALNIPCITFSRQRTAGANLLRPFYICDLFSLIENDDIQPDEKAEVVRNTEKQTVPLSPFHSSNSETTMALRLVDGCLHILGKTVKLSKKEYALMSLLLERKGRTVTYNEAAALFNGNPDSNTVNVYIRYLRKKISAVTSLNIIENIREVGYIIR